VLRSTHHPKMNHRAARAGHRREQRDADETRGTAHAVILLDGEQVETKPHDNAVWRVDGRVIRMQFLDMSQACATSPSGILEDAVRGLSAVVAHEQELHTRWAHYDDGSSFVALLVQWSDPGVPPVAVAATVVGDQVVMLASAVPEDDWRPVAERLFHMILTTRVSAGWIDPSAPLSPLRRQLPVEPQALPAGCAGCTASLFAP